MRSALRGIWLLLSRAILLPSVKIGYFYYDGLGVEKDLEKARGYADNIIFENLSLDLLK